MALTKIIAGEEINDIKFDTESTLIKTIAVIGFGMGTGTKTVATHLALVLAKRGYNVGMFDGNMFSPSLLYFLDEPVRKSDSISTYFNGSRELRELFKKAKISDNLRFLSTSPDDTPMDIVGITEDDMTIVYEYLKESFDFVIVPINYDPIAPWFTSLIDNVDIGFFIWDEQKECVLKTKYALDYINKICGKIQANKINNVIINKRTREPINEEYIRKIQCELISELPYIDQIMADKQRNEIYMKRASINSKYKKEFTYIVNSIFKNYYK